MTSPRLLVATTLAVVGFAGVVALVLVSGGGKPDSRTAQPVADRYALLLITPAVELCGDFEVDPGIAPRPAETSEGIDPGILAPTRSSDGYALRVVPERATPCPGPTGTPTP